MSTKERGMIPGNEGAPWGWTDRHRSQHVAIVGATGAVGRELAQLLLAAEHPRERIDCLARRFGKLELALGRVKLDVRPLESTREATDFEGTDLAFLCTPSGISRELAPALCEAGVRVIDLSSALRMRPDVPLVVPEINGGELRGAPRLVANPNCTSAIAALPLAVVQRLFGLEELILVSYQAASGAGSAGIETLHYEAREASGAPAQGAPPQSPFVARLHQNVIPAVADVGPDGTSGEEQKICEELRKILGLPGLVVESTTARVPVERCHSVAIHCRLGADLDLDRLRAELARAPGLALTEDPHGPRPLECAGSDPVHVGRIRAGTRGKRSLCFFAVGDQIRKGAALNALQIAAALPAER
ncbi:MAG: aspartate-semialdehyde dehydrogenase [Planctomycetes bacterium]|nr:aspartate-semialdehyde dehydrogenase [Planctomycetota bacterium]